MVRFVTRTQQADISFIYQQKRVSVQNQSGTSEFKIDFIREKFKRKNGVKHGSQSESANAEINFS